MAFDDGSQPPMPWAEQASCLGLVSFAFGLIMLDYVTSPAGFHLQSRKCKHQYTALPHRCRHSDMSALRSFYLVLSFDPCTPTFSSGYLLAHGETLYPASCPWWHAGSPKSETYVALRRA